MEYEVDDLVRVEGSLETYRVVYVGEEQVLLTPAHKYSDRMSLWDRGQVFKGETNKQATVRLMKDIHESHQTIDMYLEALYDAGVRFVSQDEDEW